MKGEINYKKALNLTRRKRYNKKTVFDLLIRSYNQGNSKAAYAIASWFLHGKFVKKDFRKAVEYLQFASKNNEPNACYDLAICLEKGKGHKKNLKKAFELYMRAAIFGDKQSLVEVGRCYYHGIGTRKNISLAGVFLDKAEKEKISW